MRRINIIMGVMFLLSLSIVFASLPQQPVFPVYIGLNENVEIITGSKATGVHNVSITFQGQTDYLNYYEDLDRYKIYIASNIEEDVYFSTRAYGNESQFKDLQNFDILNDDEIINDTLIRAFKYNNTDNYNITELANIIVCANVKVGVINLDIYNQDNNPNIYFVTGYENGSQIVWNKDPIEKTIINTDYQTVCSQQTIAFTSEFQNDYFYYGFYCDNCGLDMRLYLNIEIDDLLNDSVYFDDINDNTTIENNSINYGLLASISHVEPLYYFENIVKFRIPYNVTIQLYKENSTSYVPGIATPYCNQFSNIYMLRYQEDEETNNYDTVLDALNSVFFLFDPLDIQGLYGVETDDNNELEFFNGVYSDCSATITLYETGNYSVYLVGSKQVIQDHDYAFTDPATGSEQFVSKITQDQALVFTIKDNYDVSIFTTDWEISKIWVLLNVGKWLLITVLPVLLIFLIKSGVLSAWIVKRI